MRLVFNVDGIKWIPSFNNNKDLTYINNDSYPIYLKIGFNELVENGESIDLKITEIHRNIILNGILSKDPSKLAFSCLIAYLFVPIYDGSQDNKIVYSMQSKTVICYFDQMSKGKSKIYMKNHFGETLLTFRFELLDNDFNNSFGNKLENIRKDSLSSYKKIVSIYAENGKNKFEELFNPPKYPYCWVIYDQIGLNESDPVYSFLSNRTIDTNEEYWIQSLDALLKIKKTEYGVYFEDNKIFFDRLRMSEKLNILADLISFLSVNTNYCYDYVIKQNGSLIMDNMCCSVFEDSGDCEDLTVLSYYCWRSFNSIKNYKDPILNYLRQIAEYYIYFFTHSWFDDNKNNNYGCYHACGVLVLKKELYSNIIEVKDKKIEKGLSNIKTHDKDNLVSSILNNNKLENLPNTVYIECTSFVYNFKVDDKLLKDSQREHIKKTNFRIYHSDKNHKVNRYFIGFTTYFIDHVEHPTNIEAFYFVSSKKENGKYEYGIDYNQFMYSNFHDGTLKFIPQSKYNNLNDFIDLTKIVTSNRIQYQPLKIVNRILINRSKTFRKMTSNIKEIEMSKDDNSKFYYSLVPSENVEAFAKKYKNYIKSYKVFKLSQHIDCHLFIYTKDKLIKTK